MTQEVDAKDYKLTYGIKEYHEMVDLYNFAEAVYHLAFDKTAGTTIGAVSDTIEATRNKTYEKLNRVYDCKIPEATLPVVVVSSKTDLQSLPSETTDEPKKKMRKLN
jgi:hypothetical protein